MMFLDCPAYLNHEGAERCGLSAEVRCRFIMQSTDGPLECAMIRCPAGHYFNGSIESLTWEGRSAPRHSRAEPDIARPNTAPAYYLGHPARLWISVIRRRRTTPDHPTHPPTVLAPGQSVIQ